MASDVSALSREPDILIGMVLELRGENGRLRAMLETLRRTLYGARSERFDSDPGQLALGLEDVSTALVEPEPEATKPRSQDGRTRPKPMRNIGGLPKHLPREDVVIEPAIDHCPCCQGRLHCIGEDVSEMLDIVPAILRTAALLAHIAAAKFAWHLPLHRQTQMLAAYGIQLDRSTLVHWIGRTAWWLQPLYALLTETVMAAGKVFCDDTPLPVLDRTRRRTRIARLWCYAVDDRPWQGPAPPAVVYRYAEDRRGRHVKEHLNGFNGVLQVDGYTGYDSLANPNRPGGAITLAYCLAHARREFFDVHKRTKDPVAAEALRRIGEIYAIEARIRGCPADERVAVRQAETKPLMAALWSWLMQRLEEISAKSSLATAIRYTLGHWAGLTVFLVDGRVEVDNNTVERCIRPIPLGRKNALFAGSHRGGERWAVLASLINTAKLHEIDPETYLADVLDRIVSGRTKVNALRELLPWNWKAARAASIAAAA
jgi:transposase